MVFIGAIILIGIIMILAKHAAARKQEKEAARKEQEAREAREAQERARRAKIQEEIQEERKRQERIENEIRAREDAINRNPLAAKYRTAFTEEVSVSKLNITEFKPYVKKCFVAFDLETTGLSDADDAIVEIGAVKVEGGQITATYSTFVDPERPMPVAASRVNHITDSMLVGAPKIYEVLPDFLEFVGDAPAVAHNARFDVNFISQACMRNRFRPLVMCFDSMSLARYWPDSPNKKLQSLAAAAGIDTGTAHRALDDAMTVAQLVLKSFAK